VSLILDTSDRPVLLRAPRRAWRPASASRPGGDRREGTGPGPNGRTGRPRCTTRGNVRRCSRRDARCP